MTPYDRLAALSESWLDKVVVPIRSQWTQTFDEIVVPAGDEEGLLHEIAHWAVATEIEYSESNLMLYDDHDEFENPPPWWDPHRTVPRREFEAVRLGEAVYRAAGRLLPGYAAVSWSFRRRFDALPPRVRRSIDKTWRRRVARYPGLFEALVDAVRRREADTPDTYYTTLTRHIAPPEPGGFLRQVRWGFRCLHCSQRAEGHLCNVVPRPGGGWFRCKHCNGELAYHPVWVGSIGDDDVIAGFISMTDSPINFDNIEAKHVA